jgi:hypothetical protein
VRRPFLSVHVVRPDGAGRYYPPAGGYGPWRLLRLVSFGPVSCTPKDTATFVLYLCIPLHMSRAALRAQYLWASERSDRRAYLPSERFAPKR